MKTVKFTLFLVISMLSFSLVTVAWDGYDYDSGDYVEIGSGDLVRTGNDIPIYDYNDGSYHDVFVESVTGHGGSSATIDVYDYDTGDYRTLEMGC